LTEEDELTERVSEIDRLVRSFGMNLEADSRDEVKHIEENDQPFVTRMMQVDGQE